MSKNKIPMFEKKKKTSICVTVDGDNLKKLKTFLKENYNEGILLSTVFNTFLNNFIVEMKL